MNSSKIIIDNKKIRTEINDLKKSLLNFRFQKTTGQLEKTSEIRKVRKNIARLKTRINNQKGGTDV
jgi:large subunit ribosomal protein L29|tara:strand:+ start:602 stop:799 length:198 start_codon:yes stop_codon:yes gene_type:complete